MIRLDTDLGPPISLQTGAYLECGKTGLMPWVSFGGVPTQDAVEAHAFFLPCGKIESGSEIKLGNNFVSAPQLLPKLLPFLARTPLTESSWRTRMPRHCLHDTAALSATAPGDASAYKLSELQPLPACLFLPGPTKESNNSATIMRTGL